MVYIFCRTKNGILMKVVSYFELGASKKFYFFPKESSFYNGHNIVRATYIQATFFKEFRCENSEDVMKIFHKIQ